MAKDDKVIEPVGSRVDPKKDKPILAWESPDRVIYSKGALWYITVVVIALALATILYFQHLLSGVALVFAAVIMFMFMSQSKPRSVKSAVYTQGIVIADKVYRYSDFKSFWITLADVPKARLQMTGIAGGVLTMPLVGVDPEQIRLYLSRYLPEDDDKGEDLSETVNRFLRF